MKLFPDEQTKKRFMKNGLPVIFGIAWTPIIWMLLVSATGPLMQRMIGSWQVNVSILVVATLVAMVALIRLFKMAGLKIFDKLD